MAAGRAVKRLPRNSRVFERRQAADFSGQGCEPVVVEIQLAQRVQPCQRRWQAGKLVFMKVQLAECAELANGCGKRRQAVLIKTQFLQNAGNSPRLSGSDVSWLAVALK